MMHSRDLLEFVKAKEAVRLTAYQDAGGVWTIGWGHTAGVFSGMTCTPEQASAWLDQELAGVSAAVTAVVKIPLAQYQFDALVDFAYNCGDSALADSTLLKKVNGAEHDAAVVQLLRWGKDGGRYVNGLLARRAGEGLMYAFGIYNAYS